MVRFIHAADIHLDSPMLQLEQYDGAPADEIRLSTRQALTNLIDYAINQGVDFLLIAGDLYDGDWRDHNTGLFFAKEARRLREANIPLYFISGNHDAQSKLTKALPLPENPDGSPMQLSSKRVDRVELDRLGVVIHGRGFRKQAETDNLAEKYPAAVSGMFNIGMLHTSLQGASGHAPYAPCTPAQLADKGYDYWALGHIHQRENRAIDDSCPIVFSGNTQGRSVRECGAKGCVLVELDEGHPAKLTFHSLDVCRWHICELDITSVSNLDDVMQQFCERLETIHESDGPRTSIVRLVLSGNTSLHSRLHARYEHWQGVMRQQCIDTDADGIWMERLRLKTTTVKQHEPSDIGGPILELLATIDQMKNDESAIAAINASLAPLASKMPAEIVESRNSDQWADNDQLRQWMEESEPILLEMLQTAEANQ